MAQTGIHYKTKWLNGDNSVNIHAKIMVLVQGTSIFFIEILSGIYVWNCIKVIVFWYVI